MSLLLILGVRRYMNTNDNKLAPTKINDPNVTLLYFLMREEYENKSLFLY